MNGNTSTEVIDEVSKWSVGLGILTLALAPLAIPFLVLTAVALIPLVLPVVAIAVVAAVFTVPVLLLRGLGRRLRARVASPRAASPQRGPQEGSRQARARPS
jgi:membrane protein implicated in regulation of membrane protease activity